MTRKNTITNCRQTRFIVRKSHTTITKHQEDKLQTNPFHREEEPHNNHETPGRQIKQSNQLSLPYRDDCKTRMDTK